MLDTRWLEGFVAVAQSKSFTRAADVQNVSISGLSRRIKALEDWAGTNLFDRGGECLALTGAGNLLLPAAMDVIRTLKSVRRGIAEMTSQTRNELRISAPHIMSSVFFSWWLGKVSEQFGSPKIVIESANLPECFAALTDGETDVLACVIDHAGDILAGIANSHPIEKFDRVTVGTETLVPVSAPDLPADKHRLLVYQPGCSLGWSVNALIERERLNLPKCADLRAGLADSLKAMVLSGLGIGWLPSRMVQAELLQGRLIQALPKQYSIPMDIQLFRLQTGKNAIADRLWQTEVRTTPAPKQIGSGRFPSDADLVQSRA